MSPGPPRRPPLGARTPVSRPRKVAGRQAPVGPPAPDVAEPDGRPDEAVAHDEDWPTEAPRRTGSGRATGVLVSAIVLLAALAGAEAYYLWGSDDPVVSSSRPVVIGQVNAASAVDVAATAAQQISEWSWETYDEDADADATLMTEEFASRFRDTKADARERVMAQKTAVTAEVAMQGVVRASPEQVVALVYLDQSNTTDGKDSRFSQYMILVTVVRTDSGWLVSKMETF
jgi:Mce-associated membrane protein